MANRTLPQLFEDCVKSFSGNVLMWQKTGDKFEGTTYAEMRERVHAFGAGLVALGLRRGDRAALISEGRNDWVMSELGILCAGAVNVPISVKVEELSDLKFRLAHSGCRMVIVSQNHVSKIRRIKKDLPDLERTIVLDRLSACEPDEMFAADVMAKGREYLAGHAPDFEALWRSVGENDFANICYTSGTTADPKGIILTHRNYTANVEQSLSLVTCGPDDILLLMLPWDHAFGHTCGIYTMMSCGAAMASVQQGRTPLETVRNAPLNIKELRPHLLLSVPALAKTFRKGIEKGIRDKGPRVARLFQRALKLAYGYNAEGWNRGKGLRILKKPFYALYDKLIFSKIREGFDDRLRFFVGGGALLDIELQRFFYAVRLPMFQGYGLTEAAPVISANSLKAHKLGSSGRVAAGITLKICDDQGLALPAGRTGEIVIRGENVMAGYWKNEKATQEALRNGWLYTGDLGYLDEDEYLYVLGRVKSLLIDNTGEKYSPEVIEEALVESSPCIDQLMLYNSQSPFTVALLVPNKEALLAWLKERNLSCRTEEGQKAALQLLQGEIGAFRQGGKHEGMFPQRWMPTAVAVLGEAFTEENRFINSTLKMVRSRIVDHYRSRIDFLFTAEAKDIANRQNMTIMSRLE